MPNKEIPLRETLVMKLKDAAWLISVDFCPLQVRMQLNHILPRATPTGTKSWHQHFKRLVTTTSVMVDAFWGMSGRRPARVVTSNSRRILNLYKPATLKQVRNQSDITTGLKLLQHLRHAMWFVEIIRVTKQESFASKRNNKYSKLQW